MKFNRVIQAIYTVAVIILSWLAMQATHELGHVLGAVATGGTVQQVVLHPLEISRTDVAPNPQPGIVVWAGPIIGALAPLALMFALRKTKWRGVTQFFAGFCLIANGAYIGLGSFTEVGDCREMLETGSPIWTLWLFGLLATTVGIFLWHRLGSPVEWWRTTNVNYKQRSIWAILLLLCVATLEVLFASGS